MTTRTFLHKITRDILISFVITYFLLIVPELILPGLISSHFSPKYLLVAILLLGWLYAWQGQRYPQAESVKFRAISKNILNIILFVITLMLLLSLYKMKIWQILIVTIFSVALVVAAGNIFTDRNDTKKN
ncbi:MAG: hypothetical protein A3J76_00545 [Candidatus Moranbacteria bacterium RBG_13_45_13]|nr:MAG: hypothetical protein A3J76_00545 [Candidatus Moranbacteria bacterium RBG_13_45_13]